MESGDFCQTGLILGGQSLSFNFFQSLLADIDIGKDQFEIDFHRVRNGVNWSTVIGDDFAVFKTADNMDDGIRVSDIT